MAVSKVTRNYQVTVPREVREVANIKEGDTLLFVKEDGDIVLRKIDKDILRNSFGIWKRAQEKSSWSVNRLIRSEAEKRLKKFKLA